MADLDTVKVILRSLVMSRKGPMSSYVLQKDYRDVEGKECPYAALGYRSFVSFLESIPDTVRILPGGTVVAVATEETQHIARLVALQKSSKPKARRGTYRSCSYGQGPSSYNGPPRFQQSDSYYRPQRSYSSSSAGTYSRTGSSYGVASGGGSSGAGTYSRTGSSDGVASGGGSSGAGTYSRTGSSYGVASGGGSSGAGTYSRTGSSYGVASGGGRREGSTYVSRPTSSNTSFQSSSQSRSNPLDDRPSNRSTNTSRSTHQENEEYFKTVREAKEKKRAEELRLNSPSESRTPTPTDADLKTHKVKYCPERYSSEGSDDSFYERFKDEEDEVLDQSKPQPIVKTAAMGPQSNTAAKDPYFQSSDAISDPLKTNLKKLIKSYPDGLWACVLPEKYKEKYGVNLQWNELGYDSIVQMVHDLPDIIVCKRVQGGDWKLYDASLPLSGESVDNYENSVHGACFVPESVKSKIFDVVKLYKSGIRADQLAELYHEFNSRVLLMDAPGFDSVESLLISIDGTVIHLRYVREECYVLPGEPPLPAAVEPAVKVSVDVKQELGLYPDEVMGPKESYPPPQLPSNLQPGDYLELMVAEVYNPFKLWVMLREKSVQLDKLMDELQDFYQYHGEKYLMPDSTINVGQCCTAIYDGEWHRATITSVGKTIEVFYVDYGTVASVSKKELRFLHRDFNSLPIQAIRASLSGIQPTNGRQSFTMEANQALLGLVAEKPLMGLVIKIDQETPFLELFLIDTTGDTDIHLNDVLVEQKHAMFKSELLSNNNPPKPEEECSVPVETPSKSQPSIHSAAVSAQQSSGTTPSQQQPQPPPGQHPQPPPGFGAFGQAPPVPTSSGISPWNNVNPGFNTMLNQTIPAYPAPEVNPAILMQQQQQAYFMAMYYQNLYQQSLLRMAAASAGNNSWLGSYAPNTNTYNPPGSVASPGNTYAPQRTSISHSEVAAPSVKSSTEEKDKSSQEPPASHINVPSHSSEGKQPHLTPMSDTSDTSSSSSISDLVVEHLDEHDSDSSIPSTSSSSYCNVAPDLVQSVANISLHQSPIITSYWKVEEVCEKHIHIFNLDQKAYVSLGELARKFTGFSTCDTLLRVLKNKGISPELKKITREDNLSLFSSLDGCSEEFHKCFDLSRNKVGNVVGTFYLCALSNVPAVLIPLGTNFPTVIRFRELRDSFNPNENHWKT